MAQGRSYYLWEAIQRAREAAEEAFHRKSMKHGETKEEALANCREIMVTADLKAKYNQLVTFTFSSRVPWRSMVRHYNLRQMPDYTYRVFDVDRGAYL